MTRAFRFAICIAGVLLPGCGASALEPEGDSTQRGEDSAEKVGTQESKLHTSPDCLIGPADGTFINHGSHYQGGLIYPNHGGECGYESVVDVLWPGNGYRAGFVMQPQQGVDEASCKGAFVVGKVWGWNGSEWVSLYESPGQVHGWVSHDICQAFFETPALDTTGMSSLRLVGHSASWYFFIPMTTYFRPIT